MRHFRFTRILPVILIACGNVLPLAAQQQVQKVQIRQGPLPPATEVSWTEGETAFLQTEQGKALTDALQKFFAASPEARSNFVFKASFGSHLVDRPETVRRMAWSAYRKGWERSHFDGDIRGFTVTWKHLKMPYIVRTVGQKPAGGWPLFIALHGGGGAPKQVNDMQWYVMMSYYKDHAEKGGYLYCAPRAPTDGWNGFYADFNLPMFDQLIRQLQLVTDVDPNKVFIMGYSHGGYGTYYMGMKMADRFAGAHASAADPPGNWRDCPNLRNTFFSAMVGEKDTGYDRVQGVRGFGKGRAELNAKDPTTYRGPTVIVPGNPHVGLPDRDRITLLYPEVRDPVPSHVIWSVDRNVRCFYWLRAPEQKEGEVEAICRDNTVTLTTKNLSRLDVYLDERLVDLKKPVEFNVDGRRASTKLSPSLRTICETLAERGDPELMFTVRVPLKVGKEQEKKQ